MDGAFPCVDANVSSAPLPGLNLTVYSLDSKIYRGSPVYAVFTTADPTAAVLGICTPKQGTFALVGDPLQYH